MNLQIAHALRVTGKQKRYKYQEITRKKMNRPPFGASKLHSLKRLQSHELNEYCTTPFCNGAFQGEIRYTGQGRI